MKNMQTMFALLAAVLLVGLTSGCKSSKELSLEVDKGTQTWRLVDNSTHTDIVYTTLEFDGQRVVKTMATDCFSNPEGGLYMAFKDDQLIVEGNTTRYNGGTTICGGNTWKYTLNNGVLNILKSGK